MDSHNIGPVEGFTFHLDSIQMEVHRLICANARHTGHDGRGQNHNEDSASCQWNRVMLLSHAGARKILLDWWFLETGNLWIHNFNMKN